MPSKSIVFSKPPALRQYLRSPKFSKNLRSCCLIISSAPDPTTGSHTDDVCKHLSNFVDRSIFTMTMELGLRSVHSNINAGYPTMKAVHESVELAKRSGAKVVIGVGSGAAIDLAKAVANFLAAGSDVDLIVSPASLGGTVASTSNEPLILSTEEEALLPLWAASAGKAAAPPFVTTKQVSPIVALDENEIATPLNSSLPHIATVSQSVIASITIAIDSALALSEGKRSGSRVPNEDRFVIQHTIEDAAKALHQLHAVADEGNSGKHHAVSAAVHAGQLLSFGNGGLRRSAPLSVASALLPSFFPYGNLLTYTASMMPGMCETIAESSALCSRDTSLLKEIAARLTGHEDASLHRLADWASEISREHAIPTMASLAEGAPDINTLLDRLDSNQALLNILDEDMGYLAGLLQRSLNR